MNKLIKYLVAILIGVVLGIICYDICCERHFKEDETIIKIKRDTVIFHDTIRIEKPTYHKVITRDTILLAVADTIRVNDTTYVHLPVESKVYSDSLYTAQISGYKAELDWIEVYPVTKTVTVNNTLTNTVYRKARWGIGIQAGYGATLYNGKVQLSPYIGVGVSCNFIRW